MSQLTECFLVACSIEKVCHSIPHISYLVEFALTVHSLLIPEFPDLRPHRSGL